MKDNQHYRLSNSFKSLLTKNQPKDKSEEKPKQKSTEKTLFKLNPKSADPIPDVPVEILKKKSRNKLESLKDDDKKWSIFDSKQPNLKPQPLQKKRATLSHKQVSESILGLSSQKVKKKQAIQEQVQEDYPHDIVLPSTPQLMKETHDSTTISHTIFQTPLLPCFASQFSNKHTSEFKEIKEKEGVWRIGKARFSGGTGYLNIGGIEFQAQMADIEGKAGAVGQSNFYSMPKWNGIWIAQPKQQLFTQQL